MWDNSYKWLKALPLAAILFATGVQVSAQEPRPPRANRPPDQNDFSPRDGRPENGRPRGPGDNRPFPGDQTVRFLSSDMRFGMKTVKGAPFSATSESEFVQTLGDGSKISRRNTAMLYRDGEGRVRREQQLNNVGPFATSGDAPLMIFINDPVSGVSYQLDPKNHLARRLPVRRGPPMDRPNFPAPGNAKTESLGKQVIEGVEVDGTRSTFTIPLGEIGNDRPIEIVSEQWFSPELQETILSRHRDPRLGEQTFRLTKISRGEPAASLFQPPSDFTVTEGGPPPGQGFRAPGKRREDD